MRRLRPEQTVVTLAELAPALEEIGSVQAPGQGPTPPSSASTSAATLRSLQQFSQCAVISGVFLGLARYLRLDVTLLLPYAPLEPGGAPVRWLPAKSRAFMEFLRAKLGVDRPGKIAA